MTQATPQAAISPHTRNEAYDTLRGLLLVIMAVNHVPSVLWWLTRQPIGFMTAAEGFIFISGLVVGLVYGRRWTERGAGPTTRLLWKRGLVIYRAHLGCIAAVLVWMICYRFFTGRLPYSSPWSWLEGPPGALPAAVLLLNQPGLLDVLPTYCFLLLVTPLVLWGFATGRVRATLAAGLALWVLSNLFDPPRPLRHGALNTGAFNFFAWQFLYVVGLFFGWRSDRIRPSGFAVDAVLLALIVFLSLCSHGVLTLGLTPETWFTISNKNNLAPVRLVNTLAVAWLVARWLVRRKNGFSIGPLALLGRHSLAVFAVHCVAGIIILGLPEYSEWNRYGAYASPATVVVLLFVVAGVAEWWKKRSKLRASARKEKLTRTEPLIWQPPGGGPPVRYRWHEPSDARGGERFPLVLFLHGAGERGEDNEAQLANGVLPFLENAGNLGQRCFLLAPQCPADLRWVPVDEMKHPLAPLAENELLESVLLLVRKMIAEHPVDVGRVYVAGLSMGGYGVWDLLARAPGMFAAGVPVCGGGAPETARLFAGTPVHAYHGDADPVIPVKRTLEMIEALKQAGGDPLVTILPETGHDAWSAAFADLGMLRWLFNQRRRAEAAG